MSIGTLTSAYVVSTIKYTGSPIVSKLTATTVNQQKVLFQRAGQGTARCNAFTIQAGEQELYFTVINAEMFKNENYDYTNEPVIVCPANQSISVSGVEAYGIKFSNASGANYYVMGVGF